MIVLGACSDSLDICVKERPSESEGGAKGTIRDAIRDSFTVSSVHLSWSEGGLHEEIVDVMVLCRTLSRYGDLPQNEDIGRNAVECRLLFVSDQFFEGANRFMAVDFD
jgi:hypothetical protein